MFGHAETTPQNEQTRFHPRNPYGVAKLAAFWATVNYRETYGLFACNGILYNHESDRRGEDFVTRKITMAVARIAAGSQKELRLGNLDARRDWGYAPDYVRAMWLMMQHREPGDYVIATGTTHSVRDFCELAFARVGLDWSKYVVVDPDFYRPNEAHLLVGDSTRARTVLGWQPTVSFREIVEQMVDADLARVRSGRI